jgi:hypothetical protein
MPHWGNCTQPAADSDAGSTHLAELAHLVEIANAADSRTADDGSSSETGTAVTPSASNTTSTTSAAAAADPAVAAGSTSWSTGGIVGAASGGVGVLAALLGAAYTCWKWWHKRRSIKVRPCCAGTSKQIRCMCRICHEASIKQTQRQSGPSITLVISTPTYPVLAVTC